MSQWVLKINGQVVPRQSCQPLWTAEWVSPDETKLRQIFDARIEGMYGSVVDPPKQNIKIPRHEMEPNDDFIEYEDEEEEPITFFDTNETTDSDGRAVNLTPSYDGLINAELLIYNGEKMEIAKITRRAL